MLRRVPHPRVVRVGSWVLPMTKGLQRYYGRGHLHFVTFSCYRRLPLLEAALAKDFFLSELPPRTPLEVQLRACYRRCVSAKQNRKKAIGQIVVFGVCHDVQGAAKWRGRRINDTQYRTLLRKLFRHRDFIFEEATGLGPTTAEILSL